MTTPQISSEYIIQEVHLGKALGNGTEGFVIVAGGGRMIVLAKMCCPKVLRILVPPFIF